MDCVVCVHVCKLLCVFAAAVYCSRHWLYASYTAAGKGWPLVFHSPRLTEWVTVAVVLLLCSPQARASCAKGRRWPTSTLSCRAQCTSRTAQRSPMQPPVLQHAALPLAARSRRALALLPG